MKDLNQLLLNFNHKQNFNYSDFYVSKSNYYAFQLIEKWPNWEKNILNIYGEKFSGKTHLSNIFQYKNKGIKVSEKDINDDVFKKLKLYENIVIDNYQNKSDEKLMKYLEEMQKREIIAKDTSIVVTEKGKKFHTDYSKINDLISEISKTITEE